MPEPLTLWAQFTIKAPAAGWFGKVLAVFPGYALCIKAMGKMPSHIGLAIAGTAALPTHKAAKIAALAVRETLRMQFMFFMGQFYRPRLCARTATSMWA